MYKIIGADQREYGPVNADQIRKWIAEGRANEQTRAQALGAPGWKSLLDLAEFAEALAVKAALAPPPPPLTRPAAEVGKIAAATIVRGSTLKIGDCFSRSWQLYQENFWILFGATAVVLIITLGLHSVPALGWLGIAGLGFVFWGGLDFLFLKRIRGDSADVGDAFVGFGRTFVPLMLASLVAHVLTFVGLILLILPGIYLFVGWWMFAPLLIIDKRLDFWPAMELSRKTVNRNWWPCFGLFVLSCLVCAAGLLACGVGLLLTLPIAVGAIVYAYENLLGGREETAIVAAPAPITPKPAGVESDPAGSAAQGDQNVPAEQPGTTRENPDSPAAGTPGRASE